MNALCQVVGSHARQQFVVASQVASPAGKRKIVRLWLAACASLPSVAWAQASGTLPTGGQVVAGQGSVQTQGEVMTITQTSPRMAMDWQSFSIGAGQSVRFVQPNAQAAALNRVLGSDVSTIQGQLSANGRVYLLNPNGILFTPTAQVNVGGLVASTLGMGTADFMAGQDRLAGDSTQAVTHRGQISTPQGGSVALVAAKVINDGSIVAPGGSVALASGRKVRVDLGGPALIEIEEGKLNALIEQSGSIRADGGQIYLTARAASQLSGSVINQRGLMQANSINAQGGLITLEADHIHLHSSSGIEARGAQGGGNVLIGGDWQGSGPLRQATTVNMAPGSVVDASATNVGQGGKIVLWSNVHSADSLTTAQGTLRASGGPNGGDGGQIETSGARLNTDGIQVNASATQGRPGLWLVDPFDYTIDATAAGRINTALNAGTSVEINTANPTSPTGSTSISGTGTVGNITVSSPISATTGNANLTLRGTGAVNINESIAIRGDLRVTTAGNILLTGEKAITTQGGSVVLWANNTGQATNGYVALRSNYATSTGAKIETGGGHIWMGGGSGSTTWNGLTVGDGYAVSGAAISFLPTSPSPGGTLPAGVFLQGAKLLSGGGHIYIAGRHAQSGTYGAGAVTAGNVEVNAGSGTIELQTRNLSIGVALGTGWHHAAGNVAVNGNMTLTSSNSTSSAILVNADAAGGSADGGALAGLTSMNATGGGGLTYNSLGSSSGSGLVLGYQTSQFGTLSMLANSGVVRLNTGSRRIRLENSGSTITLGFRSGTAITSSTSELRLITSDLSAAGAINFNSTGQVFIEPTTGSSFSAAVNTSTLNYSAGVTGLTIGHASNTGNVTVGSATTIAGPVTLYGGNLSINGALTATNSTVSLYRTGTGSGTVTQTAAIVADSLLVSGGNVTLENASNSINTLAATGVGSLSYRDSNALTIGTVGATSGISASGTVDVQTLTGNLTVSQNVSTSNATSSALLLNAGRSTSVGTSTGGDILLSGGALSTGTGGTTRLMTGSVSGSTGLTDLLGSGSGRFRYNSDETSTNYTAALSSGLNAIYRERPSASLGALTMTYGDTLPTLSPTGVVNGDTDAGASIVSRLNSTSGNIRAGTYAFSSTLGYAMTGSLTVNTKGITSIDSITAQNKTYNGTTAASLVTTGAVFNGRVTGDTLTVATSTGAFANKNAGTGKTVSISGLTLGGTDAANYSLSSTTASTTANITPATISAITGLTAQNKTYDGTTTASLVTTGAVFSGRVTGDTLTATGSGAFANKNVGTGKTVSISGLTLGGADAANYTLSSTTASTTANITQATISSITGITAQNKTYNGTTAASLVTTGAVFNGGVTGDALTVATSTGAFADKNAGTGKTVSISGLTLGGADAANYTLSSTTASTTANITPAAISSITGITAQNKTYDGTTAATLVTTGAAFSGRIGSDALSVGSATGVFSDKNVATGKTVSISGLTLGGADAGNYSLSSTTASTTATISRATISAITGLTAQNKTYDGNASATLVTTSAAFSGRMGSDVLTVASGTAAFADKSAANGKTVSITGLALGGTDAANYSLSSTTASTTANITPATISAITGLTAQNKTYDGNASATLVTTSAAFSGRIGSDVLTVASGTAAFADKSAANGKTVTITGLALGGTDAANYSLSSATASTTANITPATISAITGLTAQNKTYDGTTAASLVSTGAAFSGRIGSDVLTVAAGTAAFADRNAATGKAVSISGLTLGGADAANYTLSSTTASTTANITQAAISSITGLTAQNKTYDGTTAASLVNTGAVFNGRVTGDTLTVATSTGVFADKNAGTGKTVSISGLSLGGTDAGNYSLSSTTASTTANITAKTVSLAASKTYDGTAAFTGNQLTITTGVGSETLTYSGALANSKHVAPTGKYLSALTLLDGSNGGLATNYQLPSLTAAGVNNQVTISAATLTPTLTNAGVSKTYDATTNAPASFTPSWSFGGLASGDTGAALSFTSSSYNNATVAGASTLTVGGLGISSISGSNGSLTSDYVLSASSQQVAAAISKATLTVRANSDAKFVTQSDPVNFASVSYSGFVGGETASVLGGSATVTRTNASTSTAGTYAGVLQPGGLSAANYQFNYVGGDYTIVPSSQLLVRVSNVSNTYGTPTQYAVSSAEYYNGSAVVRLDNGSVSGSSVSVTNNVVTVNDGASGVATFTVSPQSGQYSAANKLKAGSYALGLTGAVTGNSANFSNTVTVVGTHQVSTKGLTASVSGGVSKVYDGMTAIHGVPLALATPETADAVSVSGLGEFSTRHAGNSLSYTINNLALSGADAGNYHLNGANSFTGSNGSITPAAISSITGLTAQNKTYDGTTAASLVTTGAVFNGSVTGDTLTVATSTGAFADPNAGTGKTVSISGLSLGGTDAGNYSLSSTSASTTADITARALTLAIDDKSKLSGASDPAWTYQIVSGSLLAGDSLSFSRSAGESPGNYLLSGAHPNYVITAPAAYLSITQAGGNTASSTPVATPAVNGLLTVAPARVSAQATQAPALATSASPAIRLASAALPTSTSSGLMLIPASQEAVKALEASDARVREPGKEAAPSATLLQAAQSQGYTGLLVVEDGIRLPAGIR